MVRHSHAFFCGLILGLLAIHIASIKFSSSKKISNTLIVIIAISAALLIGVLWEIYEFNSNAIFGFELAEKINCRDTWGDLFFDLLGGLSGAVYFLFRRKNILSKKDNF